MSCLESTLREFDKAVRKKDESHLKQLDYNFHMEILRIGGNSFLRDILSSYIIIALNMSNIFIKYIERSAAEHHEILEAIRAGNPEKTESIMFTHTSHPIEHLNS